MVKVRYLVSEASATWSREPGLICELPDDEARAAIAAGKAEPIPEEEESAASETAPETATRSARETAVMPRPRVR